MAVNKVVLIGNVGNIEAKNGVTKASLATSKRYKNKAGEQVDDTQWHRLVFFARLGEIAQQYVVKGSKIYVEGELKYSKYTGNDGIEKYSTDIIVRDMQMLDKKGETSQAPAKPVAEFDDEIPF